MENQKQSIVDRLKQAKNVLVTVNNNPNIDQLASAIAVTLALNKAGMRANAVFSGKVPSVLEFLKPDEIMDKNTDALRDFIISLDKAKADKLRYKVEDEMVKVFITPYKSSLTQEDLNFEQGEFNVDVVLALGVKDKNDLDNAITTHGRILHDATVIDISTDVEASLGTLIWTNPKASSLSEMILSLMTDIKADFLDEQIATALLTGIVAETERFSNAKTSSEVMQISGKLMGAGANQQLVVSQLQAPAPAPEPEPEPEPAPEPAAELPEPAPQEDPKPEEQPPVEETSPAEPEKPKEEDPKPEEQPPVEETSPAEPEKPKEEDGALSINHPEGEAPEEESAEEEEQDEQVQAQIHIDESGQFFPDGAPKPKPTPVNATSESTNRGMALTPPTMGGQLTANSQVDRGGDTNVDVMGQGNQQRPILSRKPMPTSQPEQTLQGLEEAVDSPHIQAGQAAPNSPPMMPPTPTPAPDQPAPESPQFPGTPPPPAVPPPMMPVVEPPSDDAPSGSL
jgi:hypothetical protein